MTWAAVVVGGVAVAGTTANLIIANQNKPDAPDTSIADRTGRLLRSQYEDWQKTYQPIELSLMSELGMNNQAIIESATEKAKTIAGKSIDTMEGVLERQNRSLGIAPTQQQEETSRRLLKLNKAAAEAGAENMARKNVRQLDDTILLGMPKGGD
jgi:hypothetical protein